MIRASGCAVLAACAALALAPPAIHAAASLDISSIHLRPGMPLEAVLTALNSQGARIVYSSALVREGMRLRETPRATRIEELLSEILAPWNLVAINDANGDWLIVRSKAPRQLPASAPRTTVDQLETVDVTASRYSLATNTGSALFLDRQAVQRIPHLADDPVRVLKLLPGVTGGDYSAALNIRGGRRDETLLMIDGAEIHNGFHFRDLDGALSVLDTHLVQGIDFTTGGMTAEHSDYMSGVVDLTTFRPAPDDEYRNTLGISFVSAYGRTGGMFAKDRGSWVAAARRGYLDLVLKEVQPADERITPRYNDLFASAQYDYDQDTSLSAHLLLSDDDLELISNADDEVDSTGTGRSGHLWLTFNHGWNDAFRTRSVLSIASMEQIRSSRGSERERSGDVVSDFDFRFLDFREDLSWSASPRQLARFGFKASRHEATYDYRLIARILDPSTPNGVIDFDRDIDVAVTGTRLGVYGSWRSKLTERLTAEAGVRWDRYRYPHDVSFDEASPRMNVVYALGERGELRAAWGVAHQPHGIDQLQVEDGVTEFFRPERATQSSVSYMHRFERNLWARVDLYIKEYAQLRPRFENALDPVELIPEAAIDRIRIDAQRAEARGVELTLRRDADTGFAGWVSASYAKARDRIAGRWAPRSWEQELSFSFAASWTGELWSLNVAGLYHNGRPITALTTAEVETPDGAVPVIVPEEYNASRLGRFTRIDLRINRDVRLSRGKISWYLEVINLLGNESPCCIQNFRVDPRDSSRVAIEESYWMPRLPSLGFQWEF